MAKRKNYDEQQGADQPATPDQGRKGGGRSVAGKDLSDSQSSGRKGRKSSTSPKKLEEEAR